MSSRCLNSALREQERFSTPLQCLDLLVCALVWVLAVHNVRAELPLARLHTISPPGGKAGTSFEVSVSGPDLDDAMQIHFSNSGITATQKMSVANLPETNKVPSGVR